MQVPAFTMVMVVPETVHTALVVEATVVVSPEVAVGVTLNVVEDHDRLARAPNEIACVACVMSKLCDTAVAPLK